MEDGLYLVGEIIVANVHSLAVAHVEKRIRQQQKMCCTSAVTIMAFSFFLDIQSLGHHLNFGTC